MWEGHGSGVAEVEGNEENSGSSPLRRREPTSDDVDQPIETNSPKGMQPKRHSFLKSHPRFSQRAKLRLMCSQSESAFNQLGLVICTSPARTATKHTSPLKSALLRCFPRNLQTELSKASHGRESQGLSVRRHRQYLTGLGEFLSS